MPEITFNLQSVGGEMSFEVNLPELHRKSVVDDNR